MARGKPLSANRSFAFVGGSLAMGLVVGVASRAARSRVANWGGGVHWDAVLALVILLATTLVAVWVHRRNLPWWRAHLCLQGEVLALWLGFATGWSVVDGSVWDELLLICCFYWLGCGGGGGLLLGGLRFLWPPRVVYGAVCPDCGYSLLGLTVPRCPECGRPFTFDELGITPDALRVTAPTPSGL